MSKELSSPQVIVVGSHAPGLFVHVHEIPSAGETVIGWDFQEPIDGGKGSNQAIATARLGVRTSFVGCVGDDRVGANLKKWLHAEQIDTKHLHVLKDKSTGIGFIILNDRGVPAMVTSMGANEDLDEKIVEQAIEDNISAQILLTQFEIRPEIAIYAARKAREKGMFTIVNPAPAVDVPVNYLYISDILVPNEIEAAKLLGNQKQPQSEEAMAEELLERSGAGCVIITLGEKGIAGADSEGTWRIYAPQVNVEDTSGAGDVYCAALAASILSKHDHRVASDWACKVAALSVTRAGSIPSFPTIEQVNYFLSTISEHK